jgi:hypothetical protein
MVVTGPFWGIAARDGTGRQILAPCGRVGNEIPSGGSAGHEIALRKGRSMNILLIVVAIIAIILLFTGGFVQSLNFLLWVGIVLLVLAVIVWLVRMLTGSRSV